MRLLHFDTFGKLVLTDFRGESFPPYAVLSHRWSDSEILFEDIASETYKKKDEGYKKLVFCAEQVARDKLQYFWIDTCCIDRWDNNERSKAINSMFQWYKNAARCYVFLSDVSATTSTSTGSVLCRDWNVSLRRSKWFTRGWTLQELIAPASVEFFSCEGQRIGDKTSLDQLLHSITGIPLAALRNCPLDQFSIFERMRWVDGRETTETEDMIYCLLGILGVSMPTNYGEGRESALERLQAEMEEGARRAPSIIPFSRNKSFVGRELQLAEVEAKLFSNPQTTSMLAIVGPGGTGKSQLALEVAHRTLKQKHCSVFWMDASDKDSLNQSYTSVAQKLGVLVGDHADIEQIVKRCIAELSTRQCLLIFDNVEGTTVADFLPHSKLCSVIFTTTESDTAKTLAPQDMVELRELTPDTALSMLQSRLRTSLSNAEQPGAIHLLRELLYLPLAVSQAAACMNASDMTVQQYQAQLHKHGQARLHDHDQAALEHSNDVREGEQGESGLRKAVAATLSLSIGQVLQSNATAVEHLYLAACVNRKDIPLDLLKAASPQARVDAIMILDRYALITRRPAKSAFDVHRLVHQALREQLQMQGRLHEYTQRTVTQLLQVFPDSDHSNRSKWRRLLPHAQYALSHSEKNDDEEVINLVEHCAGALESDGQYKRAEELYVQVMESRRRVLGNEHTYTLTSVNNLGLVLESQGKYKEAEVMHRQALEGSEKVLGREHPDTLHSVNNLGAVLASQGKYKEAEVMYRQALEGSEKVLGREHPNTLTSVNNIGSVLESQGKYKEAEVMYRQALEGSEKVLGREHPHTLTSVNNIGSVLESQGKYMEAEVMHRQALEGSEKVLGREHPHTLTSVNNLGSVLLGQGKHKEAEAMYQRALEGFEKVLGREHPHTLISVQCLAHLLATLGDYKESLHLYSRACDGYSVVLGEHHPATQACRQHRSEALLLHEQSRLPSSRRGKVKAWKRSSEQYLTRWKALWKGA